MNRKSVLVVVALVVVAIGFLVIRDPVGAAGAVRQGWALVTGALAVVADSLSTFIRHLLQG